MDTTVRIDGIEKHFGRTTALDGVSFDVRPGITGLLGPNGAGKTTLLRILATVAPQDRGTVSVLGFDPSRASQRLEVRRRLGYLPQEPGFHRNFTVFEFLDYVAILKEMTDKRARHDDVRRVIKAVGLGEKSGAKIKALSGGMRRRVGLAQSLLGDPQFLVLDEPTAGLDPEQRLRFRDLISRLGESRTVVVSTHQTEDVAALCTDVVVMHQGQALFQGTPRELTDQARGKVFTAETRMPAQLAYRTGEGLYRHIGPMGGEVPEGGTVIEPTIEDAYLLLIGDLDALEAEAA